MNKQKNIQGRIPKKTISLMLLQLFLLGNNWENLIWMNKKKEEVDNFSATHILHTKSSLLKNLSTKGKPIKKEIKLEAVEKLFWYEASQKKFNEWYEIRDTIEEIHAYFKNDFSLIKSSDLLASAREESRFWYDLKHSGAKWIYQITPVVLADIVKRYDKYEKFLHGDVAKIFWFEDSVPISYFKNLFVETENGYWYTEKWSQIAVDTHINIALWLLYYIGIENDIKHHNLKDFRNIIHQRLEDIEKWWSLSQEFIDEMKKYIRAKWLNFDQALLEEIFEKVKKDKKTKNLFTIFARFNGHPDNMIYYGFKCLYYSALIEKGLIESKGE